jgi:hypothetical protein
MQRVWVVEKERALRRMMELERGSGEGEGEGLDDRGRLRCTMTRNARSAEREGICGIVR